MGKLNIILGPMFSGKSTMLLNRYRRYKIAGKKCLLVKYAKDNRYSDKEFVTHDNIRYEAISCNELNELKDIIEEYEVICIDEIQFYIDGAHYADLWANNGKIVETCGLNGDYLREPFKQISLIIPRVDNITFITAVCQETGDDAVFTKRLTKEDTQELIGSTENYKAVSRKIYFKN
jgi:thymidine kinase